MTTLSRWFAPAALAVGIGLSAMTPVHAQSQDELARVLVNVADVVFRGSTPYDRQGDYSYDDRLTVQRDRYGRPVYYRSVPRDHYNVGNGSVYNNGRYTNNDSNRRVKCNKNGKCKVEYYDPRYDRDSHNQYNRHNQVRYDRDGRYWDGRQWRYADQRYSSRDHDDDHDDDDD